MFPIGTYSRVFPTLLSLSRRPGLSQQSGYKPAHHQNTLFREMSDRIRQSLKEPLVLQTAVDEVNHCVNCDRTVFLQIAPKAMPSSPTSLLSAASSHRTDPTHQPMAIEWLVESQDVALSQWYRTSQTGKRQPRELESLDLPRLGDRCAMSEFGDLAASLQHGELVISPAASWRKPWQRYWSTFGQTLPPAPVSDRPPWGRLGNRAVLLLPVRPQSGNMGFLLCWRSRSHPWQQHEVETALFIAQQLEMALQHTRLYQRMHRQAQRERLVNQITSQTRRSLRLPIILSEAIAQLLEALSLDRCLVYLMRQPDHATWEPDPLPILKTSHGHLVHRRQSLFEVCREPLLPSIEAFDEEGPITRWVTEHRHRAVIPDIQQDDRIGAQNVEYQRSQIRSSLVVPVLSGRRLYAMLYLNQCTYHRHWDPEDQRLAQAVADQLAISIQQASLYSQMEYQAMANAAQAEQLQRTIAELQQTQAQLLQSEKMSSLGRVVAGFAHEINNPISFVYGNLPYLERYFESLMQQIHHCHAHHAAGDLDMQRWMSDVDWDFLQEDIPKVLRSMKTGTERIRQVVLSLRNFSRLDESHRQLADVHVGLENTLLMLQHQIQDRVAIQRHYSALPAVDCYPGHLNQVFMNLLLNALESFHCQNGSKNGNENSETDDFGNTLPLPMITLETELIYPHPDEKPWVRITIADNGCGIPPENQPKIFDPFFTTRNLGEGMGLGLSICYQTIVNQHRGHLWVTSQVGQGSKFTLEIPTCHDLGLNCSSSALHIRRLAELQSS
ncbi:MAG: ATP-binding protein [Synechococcales bacterium]|nr:ATP-binding protein [Synechococcales bacterium]